MTCYICNSLTGNHYSGKQCLDIHLLKAAAHEAVADQQRGLVPCADDTRAEWVTYLYSTAHPILQWLPSKLAEWIAENLGQDLAIPEKCGDKWTVQELNNILRENLVPTGTNGGHLRTFGAIQWESELFRGRPKARCYPFDLPGHHFWGKNPKVLYGMLYNCYMVCYITCYGQDCVCLVAPFPNNPNPPEEFNVNSAWILAEQVSCGTSDPSSSSTAQSAPLGTKAKRTGTWSCPWYSSARLS